MDLTAFALQTAEVIQAILPALDPVDARVYLQLWWLAHGHGQATCTVSVEHLAHACRLSRRTVSAALRHLREHHLITVEHTGRRAAPTVYRVQLAEAAGLTYDGHLPAPWQADERQPRDTLLLNRLDPADRAMVEGLYEGLSPRDRDNLRRDALAHMRAHGWRRPESAGEALEQFMMELMIPRTFGPDRLARYSTGDANAA